MDCWVVATTDTNSSGIFTVIAHFALFFFSFAFKEKKRVGQITRPGRLYSIVLLEVSSAVSVLRR